MTGAEACALEWLQKYGGIPEATEITQISAQAWEQADTDDCGGDHLDLAIYYSTAHERRFRKQLYADEFGSLWDFMMLRIPVIRQGPEISEIMEKIDPLGQG